MPLVAAAVQPVSPCCAWRPAPAPAHGIAHQKQLQCPGGCKAGRTRMRSAAPRQEAAAAGLSRREAAALLHSLLLTPLLPGRVSAAVTLEDVTPPVAPAQPLSAR